MRGLLQAGRSRTVYIESSLNSTLWKFLGRMAYCARMPCSVSVGLFCSRVSRLCIVLQSSLAIAAASWCNAVCKLVFIKRGQRMPEPSSQRCPPVVWPVVTATFRQPNSPMDDAWPLPLRLVIAPGPATPIPTVGFSAMPQQTHTISTAPLPPVDAFQSPSTPLPPVRRNPAFHATDTRSNRPFVSLERAAVRESDSPSARPGPVSGAASQYGAQPVLRLPFLTHPFLRSR